MQFIWPAKGKRINLISCAPGMQIDLIFLYYTTKDRQNKAFMVKMQTNPIPPSVPFRTGGWGFLSFPYSPRIPFVSLSASSFS